MPVSTLSLLDPGALDAYIDLRSVPKIRFFGKNDIVERLKRAVPFDYIIICGIDVDHYRFGEGFCIDTGFPPAYLEAYEADGLIRFDPFIQAAKSARTVVIESEVYREYAPPPRLTYLQETFGVLNRTLVPVLRDQIVYSVVGFTRNVPFEEDELVFLSLVAEAIHTAVTKPLMDKFAAEHLRLSRGEISCLSLASFGKTTNAIAEETGYQPDTINTYLKTALLGLRRSLRLYDHRAYRRGEIIGVASSDRFVPT